MSGMEKKGCKRKPANNLCFASACCSINLSLSLSLMLIRRYLTRLKSMKMCKKNTWKMCAALKKRREKKREREREILKIYKPALTAELTYNWDPSFLLFFYLQCSKKKFVPFLLFLPATKSSERILVLGIMLIYDFFSLFFFFTFFSTNQEMRF